MDKKATIITYSLKDLLLLFNKESELSNVTLGDVWHPSDGFVDQKILNGKRLISDLIGFDYDFKGLVHFEAELDSIKIQLIQDENRIEGKEKYEIRGTIKDLQILNNKVIELNAFSVGKYEISIETIY